MNSERWLPVEGWPEYEVSDLGRVRRGNRILVQRSMESGYLYVTLLRPRKDFRVHRLVAQTFIGPCPDGFQCCHNDGDQNNNAAPNLRYDTPTANAQDRAKHGTQCRGVTHGRAKLTEAQVREMRKLHPKYNYTNLAERYGITPRMAWLIITRRNWAHVI